jgi:hypothetical protein
MGLWHIIFFAKTLQSAISRITLSQYCLKLQFEVFLKWCVQNHTNFSTSPSTKRFSDQHWS